MTLPPAETTGRIGRENAAWIDSALMIVATNRAKPAEIRPFARARDWTP